MEVVGVTEADGLCDLGHGHLGCAEEVHGGVDSHTVYVVDRSLAYALLKHLGKVVVW